MNTPEAANPNRSPSGFTSPQIRLAADDRVIDRAPCWRTECRSANGAYNTVIHLRSGEVVAYCHRRRYDQLAYRVDLWKHGAAA